TDLLPGVDVTLAGLPTGDVTIDVTRDADTIADRVGVLVSALNDVLTGFDAATAYDADENEAALLTGNSTIRRASDELTAAVISPVTGASLSTVGLAGVKILNDGTFEFDKTAFLAAFAADPDAVERLFSVPSGSTDESMIGRVLTEVDDATAFGTGYLRTAEEAEDARVEDLGDQIAAWDRRLELREEVLRGVYTRLETALSQLQAQSSYLASQIASLTTPSSSSSGT
ncbi:MAG: flagellar filament capping protein FliD, partial [Acidimicrobiales bacterium]